MTNRALRSAVNSVTNTTVSRHELFYAQQICRGVLYSTAKSFHTLSSTACVTLCEPIVQSGFKDFFLFLFIFVVSFLFWYVYIPLSVSLSVFVSFRFFIWLISVHICVNLYQPYFSHSAIVTFLSVSQCSHTHIHSNSSSLSWFVFQIICTI